MPCCSARSWARDEVVWNCAMNPERPKITIFDVAEQAGVSIKTVSRVVNNEPNVCENTR